MKRREYLKIISLGSFLPLFDASGLLASNFTKMAGNYLYQSEWHQWPDMAWTGPAYWGNRLQDWVLRDGRVCCDFTGENRSLHLLTLAATEQSESLRVKVNIKLAPEAQKIKGILGFRLATTGPMGDYRSAAVFGQGVDIGLDENGDFVVGKKILETELLERPREFDLEFTANLPDGNQEISIHSNGETITKIIATDRKQLSGGFALLCDLEGEKKSTAFAEVVSFGNWQIEVDNALVGEDHLFGPICFAQYTLHQNVLKLTAQLAPIEQIKDHQLSFDLFLDGQWVSQTTTSLAHESRAVHFRIDDYRYAAADTKYRIRLNLPLPEETHEYVYEGVIATEPMTQDEVKAAVFSCNFHYGFPDADVVENVAKLNPDIILFLGDQFYEGTGGFGVQYQGDYDKICLDYLRKWLMFGWSYRELFRNKPCAIIPDDHDVYHGNVWGEGGKSSDTSQGYGAAAQDSGGYKMPVKWVNMVQFSQTSHLPDPVNPALVGDGISVYYTNWDYGGVSLAILEDRKFKSSPKNVLPESAEVWNGWILNEDFDIKEHEDLPATLLGEQQEEFLESWVGEWHQGIMMKAVLSQTNFAAVATLPEGTKTGAVIPKLPIPEKGEYVMGDRPTVDMDSNGWPVPKRNKAVESIRKAFAFHIAGDQHLASYVQYGVSEFGDSGFAFAGPALNNIWPRRFWPPVEAKNHSQENPAYVGNHQDGFGNKVSVRAVANPYQHHKEPKIIHDRATGYGMVVFNKKERTITTNCWPRFIDPTEKNSSYPGWPITVSQQDNYGRTAEAWLPEINIDSDILPVVKVYDQEDQLIYALRIKDFSFKPWVFAEGKYSVEVLIPENGKTQRLNGLKAKRNQKKKLNISL